MRDIFSEGLLYLDLLEIYGSTYAVADICGIAQSNVFRGASSCSKLLNLDLVKDRASGAYQITKNLDVQRDLRKLNQRIRARENGRLRVLGADDLFGLAPDAPGEARLYQALPVLWQDAATTLDYLERSLVDLALFRSTSLPDDLIWKSASRRHDLFVPLSGFAATEISPSRPLFAIHSSHPASSEPVWSKVIATPWLVDPSVNLSLLQAQYPAVTMRQHCSDQSDLCLRPPSGPDVEVSIWVVQAECFYRFASGPSSRPWQAYDFGVRPEDPLLALTLLPLIREPLHQELVALLRRRASAGAVKHEQRV